MGFGGPGKTKVTKEGGYAIRFVNKTGAASVKGTVVEASTTTFDAVGIVPSDQPDPIGVIYEDGVADGDLVWVVTMGKVQVLLEDTTAAILDGWVRVSPNVAGRADASAAGPPGGTIIEIDNHFKELGHCLETVIAGTDKLALCLIHFN